MANDKFGGMDIGIINVDEIDKDELKALWEQSQGLMRELDNVPALARQVVFVPKSQYDYFGREDVKAAADKLGVIVVPVDYSDPFERSMAQLIIPKPDGALLFKKKEVPPLDVIVDTSDLPNERYHDRTFPKHYDKKKRAKRRQQKQARRKNKQ